MENIFERGDLEEKVTVKNFLTVQQEGTRNVKRMVIHYNLEAIIAVGYRINSKRATKFRIWATKVLKEYMIKGFVLNDEKLKIMEKALTLKSYLLEFVILGHQKKFFGEKY